MTIETSLVTWWRNNSAISALVSNRIYAFPRPQNATYPCVVYENDGTSVTHTLKEQTDFAEVQISVDAIAETVTAAKSLRTTIADEMSGLTGPVGDIAISKIRIENGPDLYEDRTDKHVSTLDLTVWHK